MDSHPSSRRPGPAVPGLLWFLLGALALPTPGLLTAQTALLAGTPHDFRMDADERPEAACRFCHVVSIGADAPGVGFPAASGGETGSRPAAPALARSSLACLGCHDGSIRSLWPRAPTSVGADPSEHPVMGASYDDWPGSGLRRASTALAAGVELVYEGGSYRVECITCHDPHDNTNGAFLRMPNRDSRLCLACHDK